MNLKGIHLTWLGHATFRIVTPGGVTIIIDPWIMNNPACPASEKKVKNVDLVLVTHGHGDHIGDAVEIIKQHNPQVVGIPEMCGWLEKKGAKTNCHDEQRRNAEDRDIKVTMVHADHSCGIQDGDQLIYGGEACRVRGRIRKRREDLSRRRHECIWRYGDHPRALCARNCHAADRRSFHHGTARGGVRLQSAQAEDRNPHAFRYISGADGKSQ